MAPRKKSQILFDPPEAGLALRSQDKSLRAYYDERAREYEKVYAKPERQHDLLLLREDLIERLRGERVLEVACGTGYWTQEIAKTAEFILASDQSTETLELARAKGLSAERVRFVQDDAYQLRQIDGTFTAGFAGFWWSHVPKSRQREFLDVFLGRLAPGARVIMVDNRFVEGNNTPISRRDSEGNTFQIRTIADGSTYEVLKNFPTDEELRESLSRYGKDIAILRSQYFWWVDFRLH